MHEFGVTVSDFLIDTVLFLFNLIEIVEIGGVALLSLEFSEFAITVLLQEDTATRDHHCFLVNDGSLGVAVLSHAVWVFRTDGESLKVVSLTRLCAAFRPTQRQREVASVSDHHVSWLRDPVINLVET